MFISYKDLAVRIECLIVVYTFTCILIGYGLSISDHCEI